MKSTLIFVFINIFISVNIFSKHEIFIDTSKNIFPYTSNRSLLIDIDPIFDYIGNMFNGSDYNTLYLNTANILYRKYENDVKVTRYRLRFYGNFSHSNRAKSSEFPSNLLNGTSKDNSYSLTFAKGSERHYNFKKLSLYHGLEILISGAYYSTNYNYDYQDGDIINDGYGLKIDRIISSDRQYYLSAGIAGIIGADYYLSNRFFINTEIRLPLVINYQIRHFDKYEDIEILTPSTVLAVEQQEKMDPISLFEVYLSTSQFIVFRAGVVF